MSSPATSWNDTTPPGHGTTLLALVQALTSAGASETEVVEQAIAQLESGRAHLIGSFRGAPLEVFSGARTARHRGELPL
jgi:hypothetical protein